MKRDLGSFGDAFDLAIVGGGITGAGVALDASLRGLRVALIDKGDFASGTSSVSSKLVHGGIRYLEHGDFRLVYEALHERGRLLRNATHLVRPLRFIIPFYSGARVAPWKYRIGLAMYDLLAGRSNVHRSYPIERRHLLHHVKGLRGDGLTGGAAYFDAQMDDARLCLEVLHSAAAVGARLANYVEAVGFERVGGTIAAVQAVDRIDGRRFVIRARQVLNVAGPWVDQVCELAGEVGTNYLQPTKGVHIVVADRGYDSAFLLLHPADGRVFFVIPWLGKTLIGTTDTFAEGSPNALTVTADDLLYLLTGHNHYFEPVLAETDVLGRFVGLRPLIRARPGQPSALSREFKLIESPTGLVSVAGGKFTTFRSMAEQATDCIVRRLGGKVCCQTRNYRLHGAPDEPGEQFELDESAKLSCEFALPAEGARHLVHRYGTAAAQVAGYLRRDARLAEPVVAGEPDLRAELAYQRDEEMAIQPDDFLLRRTRLGLFRPELLQKPPKQVDRSL